MKKNLIKGYRTALGFNQHTMAKKLDMSINSYSDKEKGKRPFTTTEINKYCEILKDNGIEADVKEIFLIFNYRNYSLGEWNVKFFIKSIVYFILAYSIAHTFDLTGQYSISIIYFSLWGFILYEAIKSESKGEVNHVKRS